MNLEVKVMGIEMRNPIIVGSSSLTNSLKNVKKCESAGAGAVVLKSLYEEQIISNTQQIVDKDEMYQWYPEAMDFAKSLSIENGIDQYLELIRECKNEVDIPIFASINCFSPNNWITFAKDLEAAGADGLELNISIFPKDDLQSSDELERTHIEILDKVRKATTLPVAVKMSSYFTNIRNISSQMDQNGAAGLVLFNRFYRPDIDIDNLHLTTRDTLSGPEEITLALRWVGLLSKKLNCDLIASTGIHDAEGIIKQILAGAAGIQICSVLYENGINHIREILSEMKAWMKRKGYYNIEEFQGLINEDPHNSIAWERIHFMKKSAGSIIKPIMG